MSLVVGRTAAIAKELALSFIMVDELNEVGRHRVREYITDREYGEVDDDDINAIMDEARKILNGTDLAREVESLRAWKQTAIIHAGQVAEQLGQGHITNVVDSLNNFETWTTENHHDLMEYPSLFVEISKLEQELKTANRERQIAVSRLAMNGKHNKFHDWISEAGEVETERKIGYIMGLSGLTGDDAHAWLEWYDPQEVA